MTESRELYGRFKVCPEKPCGAVNHPVAQFCWNCGGNLRNERTVSHDKLPAPRALPNEKSSHRLLGNLAPPEFFDAIHRLLDKKRLTSHQAENRDLLEYHLAAIRSIAPSN